MSKKWLFAALSITVLCTNAFSSDIDDLATSEDGQSHNAPVKVKVFLTPSSDLRRNIDNLFFDLQKFSKDGLLAHFYKHRCSVSDDDISYLANFSDSSRNHYSAVYNLVSTYYKEKVRRPYSIFKLSLFRPYSMYGICNMF